MNDIRLPQHYKSRLVAALIMPVMSFYYSSAALADEYKEATQQAYCAGVHQAGIVVIKRRFGETQNAQDTRDSELKKFQAQAYVEGAIRQHIVDAATASRMMRAGYADSELCNDTLFQCMEEAGARLSQTPTEMRDCTTRVSRKSIRPAIARTGIANEVLSPVSQRHRRGGGADWAQAEDPPIGGRPILTRTHRTPRPSSLSQWMELRRPYLDGFSSDPCRKI